MPVYWARIVLTKTIAVVTAGWFTLNEPTLSRSVATLLATTLLMPFENFFALFPRARAIGQLETARLLGFIPVVRGFYLSSLLQSVRSPSSCVYSNPFDDE
jgi:hypothetical protein